MALETQRTNTSIYLYRWFDNWTNRDTLKDLRFENLYLGDFEYRHYNYLQDFNAFLEDSIMFCELSEENCLDYDIVIERLRNCKQCITSYDITDYSYDEASSEFVVSPGFRKQMLIFEVSGKHKDAMYFFKKSEYSKMYETATVNTLFSNHTQYYMKLLTPKGDIMLTESNIEAILADRVLENEVNNFKISYAHVLRKSPELRRLLEKVYGVQISPNAELKSRLKWETEIYNYKRIMDSKRIQDLMQIS